MHHEISTEDKYSWVFLALENGQKIRCQIRGKVSALPMCPVAQVLPKGREEDPEILFQDGTIVRPFSIPDEEWITLIRAGMVPGQGMEVADKLDACLKALAQLRKAQDEYQNTLVALTEYHTRGLYEDSEDWREIPGFDQITFPL